MDDKYPTTARNIKHLELIAVISIFGSMLVTYIVYIPGLSGIFTLDDANTLVFLNKLGGVTNLTSLAQFLADGVGVLGRPISMLSFLIDDQYYPGDPSQYRFTNLMIHLLCGLFLVLFIKNIFELLNTEVKLKYYIVSLAPAYWLIHPLNVSTTLYIAQRMTLLMTLFTLVGLVLYTYGRKTLNSRQHLGIATIIAALAIFGTLATLSKENGALIVIYVLVLELTLLKDLPRPKLFKYWFYGFIVFPILIMLGYIIYNFGNLSIPYNYRDFTLVERLLTEFRILISYLYQILIPPSGGTGLYHDDIAISKSLISPITTLLSLIGIVALIYLAIRSRKSQPVLSFSLLWFFGGHILESTVLPLELYFEHRNYLPMVGPLIGEIYYIYLFASKQQISTRRNLLLSLPIALIFLSSIFTFQSARIWGTPDLMYFSWQKEHPNSLRATTMYATSLEKRGNYSEAIKLLENNYKTHSDTVSLPLYILAISCHSSMTPNFDIRDITKAASHAVYRGILTQVLDQLIKTIQDSNCTYVKIDDIISILIALEKSERISNHTKANLMFMLSELYVKKGELNSAIEALDRAFQKQPIPTFALRQAELLSSAGLYQDALVYIEKAKQADLRRKIFKPSERVIIAKMQKSILEKINLKSK